MTQAEIRRNPPASTITLDMPVPRCSLGGSGSRSSEARPDEPADRAERQEEEARHDINRYGLAQT
jgi:hypothetical protein